jgi:hypothetical protein
MEVREGSIVIVRGGFGIEEPQEVTVEEFDEKNGRTLICYTDNNGDGRWAYLYQIERIVRY